MAAGGPFGDPRALSDVLGALPRGEAVTLGQTIGGLGPRAHGCALLLLALPDALPLPIPSVSAVLALPLLAVTLHLAAHGGAGGLPRRVEGFAMPAVVVAALRDRVAPVLRRAEGLSHPRWEGVAHAERLLALVALYLGAVLLLPLPFFNTPPALCLALLGWGMVQRDGLVVLAGLAGTAAMTVALAALGGGLWRAALAWVG